MAICSIAILFALVLKSPFGGLKALMLMICLFGIPAGHLLAPEIFNSTAMHIISMVFIIANMVMLTFTAVKAVQKGRL